MKISLNYKKETNKRLSYLLDLLPMDIRDYLVSYFERTPNISIDEIRLNPRVIDGVETFNACRTDFENKLAEQYAKNYGLLPFSGSDNHISFNMPRLGGIKTKIPLESGADFVEIVKKGEYKLIKEKVDLK